MRTEADSPRGDPKVQLPGWYWRLAPLPVTMELSTSYEPGPGVSGPEKMPSFTLWFVRGERKMPGGPGEVGWQR